MMIMMMHDLYHSLEEYEDESSASKILVLEDDDPMDMPYGYVIIWYDMYMLCD